ncbi:uncharacterized protein N0V89_005928 [Didymosphaeria variabile]|uniref:LYR motif-containing protein Cup1-like N-terminal domain-containing protein n=1 Tax=Didymosphaeria variabile TaxID=1932322 RepID=A0A9W8XML8_9PLEO|nr:uncharacterized protein N0V89_005928 [Didymosphaeria variabile]KAJ4354194.1 hypothetical protein N0V89_005928 [Didymosphaeria variabile]
MQAPLPQQTVSNLKSIHLLRALLREASYLPDANARQYFRRYIVNRFRAYQPAHNASPSFHAKAVEKERHGFGKRRDISIIQDRTREMQHRGKKGLNYLRRANNGEYLCLQKILYFTYGRIGERKYALLEHLLRPDDPPAVEESSPLQKLYYSNERYLSFFDAPKKASPTHHNIQISDRYRRLKTAIKSQVQNEIALGREIKRPHLHTPINNVWERPMPIRRARNNVRRWYAETMTRFLPPLPAEEFDQIQAMAHGKEKISLVKRRSPAIELHPSKELPEADRFAKRVQDALILEKPSKADACIRPRRIDARFMRRMYAAILTYSSKLEWNDRYKKWESVWGNRLNEMNSELNSEAHHDDLFAGVDEKGNLLKQRDSSLAKEEEDVKQFLNSSLADYQKAKGKKEKYTVVPFYVDFLPPDHPVRIATKKIWAKDRIHSASGASTPRKTDVNNRSIRT